MGVMIYPDPKYRADPNRAVYVHGPIENELVHRLTPEILRLQHESRSPITVYIDSPGGSIASLQSLWDILTASDPDLAPPCRIITVVTSRAASAAADLLVWGDYAIAYPESRILYHGVTTPLPRPPLTIEDISSTASTLRAMNEDFAAELMDKLEIRLMFRFMEVKNEYARLRKGAVGKSMSVAQYFEAVVYNSLSEHAKGLFETAKGRQGRYEQLLAAIRKAHLHETNAETEASIIKAIVDFEVKSHENDPEWSFRTGGLATLNEDFFLLEERLSALEGNDFDSLCIDAAKLVLSRPEQNQIAKAPKHMKNQIKLQKIRPVLEPVWSFFAALCHALQEGENELTANDAFYLGLVDEIMGVQGYAPRRNLAEFKPDISTPEPAKTKRGRQRSQT
jgi:ATP-dependent protease ClpP protease subunit